MDKRKRPTKHEKNLQTLQVSGIIIGLVVGLSIAIYAAVILQNYLIGGIGVGIFTVSMIALFNPLGLFPPKSANPLNFKSG